MNWRSDCGSATIWVLGFGALVVAVALLTVLRGTAVLARHRLERAADLAALSAAQQIGRGAQPCAAASRITAANAANLVSCTARLDPSGRSGTVSVTVRRTVGFPLLGARTLTSQSRAGRLPALTAAPPHASAASRGSRSERRRLRAARAPPDPRLVRAGHGPPPL